MFLTQSRIFSLLHSQKLQILLLCVVDKSGEHFEDETILAKKKIGKSRRFVVKWKGGDDFNNSWMLLANVLFANTRGGNVVFAGVGRGL